jgi:hypothetical protein
VHILTCFSFDCLKYFRFLARDLAYLACLVQVSYLFLLAAVVTHPLQLLYVFYEVLSEVGAMCVLQQLVYSGDIYCRKAAAAALGVDCDLALSALKKRVVQVVRLD